MAKLTKAFEGVPDGEIYPRTLEEGTECPPELLAAALALGAVDEKEGKAELAKAEAAARAAAKAAAKAEEAKPE